MAENVGYVASLMSTQNVEAMEKWFAGNVGVSFRYLARET